MCPGTEDPPGAGFPPVQDPDGCLGLEAARHGSCRLNRRDHPCFLDYPGPCATSEGIDVGHSSAYPAGFIDTLSRIDAEVDLRATEAARHMRNAEHHRGPIEVASGVDRVDRSDDHRDTFEDPEAEILYPRVGPLDSGRRIGGNRRGGPGHDFHLGLPDHRLGVAINGPGHGRPGQVVGAECVPVDNQYSTDPGQREILQGILPEGPGADDHDRGAVHHFREITRGKLAGHDLAKIDPAHRASPLPKSGRATESCGA